MENNKLTKRCMIDILVILLLFICLVISLSFNLRKDKPMRDYELKNLHKENIHYLKLIDSLNNDNKKLSGENIKINQSIDSINLELNKNYGEIKRLKDEKNKVINYVNALSSNDIAKSLTEYLEKR